MGMHENGIVLFYLKFRYRKALYEYLRVLTVINAILEIVV